MRRIWNLIEHIKILKRSIDLQAGDNIRLNFDI